MARCKPALPLASKTSLRSYARRLDVIMPLNAGDAMVGPPHDPLAVDHYVPCGLPSEGSLN